MSDDETTAGFATADEVDPESVDSDPVDGSGRELPVEPGSPSLENALFVVLGVIGALGVVLRMAQLLG